MQAALSLIPHRRAHTTCAYSLFSANTPPFKLATSFTSAVNRFFFSSSVRHGWKYWMQSRVVAPGLARSHRTSRLCVSSAFGLMSGTDGFADAPPAPGAEGAPPPGAAGLRFLGFGCPFAPPAGALAPAADADADAPAPSSAFRFFVGRVGDTGLPALLPPF